MLFKLMSMGYVYMLYKLYLYSKKMNPRTQRAQTMMETIGHCSQIEQDKFKVCSQSNPDQFYTVSKTNAIRIAHFESWNAQNFSFASTVIQAKSKRLESEKRKMEMFRDSCVWTARSDLLRILDSRT